MTGSEVITLRDGTVVSLAVLKCLWAIEARGGRLNRTDDGGFQVMPQGIVTPNDRVFLREHRDEARRLVRYQADDSHLTGQTAPERLALVS
jgi:hypothetical protein